jgi:predicted nuclease of predicted toxin-antitoxin system
LPAPLKGCPGKSLLREIRVKFLADENFPFPALTALRDRGYDVTSVAEGYAVSSDEAVAAICDGEDRVLLTFDKDFGELVFRRGLSSGSSVVLLRIMPEPRLVADIIQSLIETGILSGGVFCVVTRDRVRVRHRPFHPSVTNQIPGETVLLFSENWLETRVKAERFRRVEQNLREGGMIGIEQVIAL